MARVSGRPSSSGTTSSGTSGTFTTQEKAKLAGIETGATADQTGAEIKTAYEGEADTNAFTDAEKTKLTGIETNAKDDQTGAEILALISDADSTGRGFMSAAQASKLTDLEVVRIGPAGTVSALEGARSGTTPSNVLVVTAGIDISTSSTDVFDASDGSELSALETGDLLIWDDGQDRWERVVNLPESVMAAATNLTAAASATTVTVQSSTGTNAVLPAATASAAGVMTAADKTKLTGVETNAKDDQTGAEIKTAYEGEANTNAFTDAEKTKLTGVETAATADQTGAEIKTAYEGEANTNAFTDAEKTKLAGVETGAKDDQTGGEILTLIADASSTQRGFMSAAQASKLADLEVVRISPAGTVSVLEGARSGATPSNVLVVAAELDISTSATDVFDASDNSELSALEVGDLLIWDDGQDRWERVINLPESMMAEATNLTATASATTLTIQSSTGTNAVLPAATTVAAGVMAAADKTKLDGIETAATADQTGAEIKTAYEGEANTNAFTDAEKTKLAGVETSAKDDQTGAEIKTAYEGEADTNAFTDAEKTKLENLGTGDIPVMEGLPFLETILGAADAGTAVDLGIGEQPTNVHLPVRMAAGTESSNNLDYFTFDPSTDSHVVTARRRGVVLVQGVVSVNTPSGNNNRILMDTLVRRTRSSVNKDFLAGSPYTRSLSGRIYDHPSAISIPVEAGDDLRILLDAENQATTVGTLVGARFTFTWLGSVKGEPGQTAAYHGVTHEGTTTFDPVEAEADVDQLDVWYLVAGSGTSGALLGRENQFVRKTSGDVFEFETPTDGTPYFIVADTAESGGTDSIVDILIFRNGIPRQLDANAFTDVEKAKLAGKESGAAASELGDYQLAATYRTVAFVDAATYAGNPAVRRLRFNNATVADATAFKFNVDPADLDLFDRRVRVGARVDVVAGASKWSGVITSSAQTLSTNVYEVTVPAGAGKPEIAADTDVSVVLQGQWESEVSDIADRQILASRSTTQVETIRSVPQSIFSYGAFADSELSSGAPPVASGSTYTDTGPTAPASDRWHRLPGPAIAAAAGRPLWQETIPVNYTNDVWGVAQPVYERLDSVNNVLYATNDNGANAANPAPANWTHFAIRQPDGSVGPWIRRAQEPLVETLIYDTGTRNFPTNGGIFLNTPGAVVHDFADFESLRGTIHAYGPGPDYFVIYHQECFADSGVLSEIVTYAHTHRDVAHGALRVALGGPFNVAEMAVVAAPHGVTASGWQTPGLGNPGILADLVFLAEGPAITPPTDRRFRHVFMPGDSRGAGRFRLYGRSRG